MRPKIAATLEGVNTNQLYKGPQAKLKKRPPKVRLTYLFMKFDRHSSSLQLILKQMNQKEVYGYW